MTNKCLFDEVNDLVRSLQDELSELDISLASANTKDKSDKKLLDVLKKGKFYDIPPQIRKTLNSGKKYMVLKGGRGSAKTMSAALWIIEESFKPQMNGRTIVIGRELSTSLQQSVYSVFKDQCTTGKMADFFDVGARSIKNTLNNVRIVFLGFRLTGGATSKSQRDKLKGLSNVSLVWIDEAAALAQELIDVLLPTISRKAVKSPIKPKFRPLFDDHIQAADLKNSRFLFTLNPIKPRDPIIAAVQRYKDDAIIQHINIYDLPKRFQDKQLLLEGEAFKEENIKQYNHHFLGEPSPEYERRPFAKHEFINFDDLEKNNLINSVAVKGCLVDPAGDGSDSTCLVVALTIKTNDGRALDCITGKLYQENIADSLPDIVEIANSLEIGIIHYEKNGLGQLLGTLLDDYPIKYHGFTSYENKQRKINSIAGQTSGKIAVLSYLDNEWFHQVDEYMNGNEHDDAADGFVMAAAQFFGFSVDRYVFQDTTRGRQ